MECCRVGEIMDHVSADGKMRGRGDEWGQKGQEQDRFLILL